MMAVITAGALIGLYISQRRINLLESELKPLHDDTVPPNASAKQLVDLLASPVVAKYTTGASPAPDYIHPRVQKAKDRLIEMGTEIYPELAEHMYDDRYSYSDHDVFLTNQNVGSAIRKVMAMGVEFYGYGYNARMGPKASGPHPWFVQFINDEYADDYAKYATHAKGRPKKELMKEYIEWAIKIEKGYGFADQVEQKKILGKYEEKLAELSQP